MTYSPGNPGYPPAQPGGSYPGATPSFAKTDDGESKLPLYLNIAVVVLGLAVYLLNFGPTFVAGRRPGPGPPVAARGDAGTAVLVALLAALLAGAELAAQGEELRRGGRGDRRTGCAAGDLGDDQHARGLRIGWAIWPLVASSVLQAIAAVVVVLLEAGVITAPPPRPKYDPYAQYGQYGGQYGQQYGGQPGYYGQQPGYQQHGGPQSHNAQPSGVRVAVRRLFAEPGSDAKRDPDHRWFQRSAGRRDRSRSSQQGPLTPPTGFPSFSPPPSVSGEGSEAGSATAGYSNHAGEQQSPSTPPGPAPS